MLIAASTTATRLKINTGMVSAVQEIGSVLGPLYGALVLAVADWEAIFWINLAVGLVLAAAMSRLAETRSSSRGSPDLLGWLLSEAATFDARTKAA